MSDDPLTEVYRAANPPQAHLLLQELADAGIEGVVENEALEGAVGEFPPGWPTQPRVMVRSSQAEAARPIVDAFDDSTVRAANETSAEGGEKCLSCGEPLAPNAERCEKCGWTYAAS